MVNLDVKIEWRVSVSGGIPVLVLELPDVGCDVDRLR
jgi:hypothetical protein